MSTWSSARTAPLGWLAYAGLSLALSVAAWTLPPRADPPPPPPTLPRQPTAAELARVEAALATLRGELAAAARRRGAPLPAAGLEELDPDGVPWLPAGLPDNPLRPEVASVVARCPAVALPQDEADWVYCPEDAGIAAAGLPASGG